MKLDTKLVCKSYDKGGLICRDGFPTSPACYGAMCGSCGDWYAARNPPPCMDDDFAPKHLIGDDGNPLLARHKRNTPRTG